MCALRTSCERSRDLRGDKQKDAETHAASSRKLSHHGSAALPPRLDWGKRPRLSIIGPLGGASETRFLPAAAAVSVRQEGRGAERSGEERSRQLPDRRWRRSARRVAHNRDRTGGRERERERGREREDLLRARQSASTQPSINYQLRIRLRSTTCPQVSPGVLRCLSAQYKRPNFKFWHSFQFALFIKTDLKGIMGYIGTPATHSKPSLTDRL